jgi:hypothetical protein
MKPWQIRCVILATALVELTGQARRKKRKARIVEVSYQPRQHPCSMYIEPTDGTMIVNYFGVDDVLQFSAIDLPGPSVTILSSRREYMSEISRRIEPNV